MATSANADTPVVPRVPAGDGGECGRMVEEMYAEIFEARAQKELEDRIDAEDREEERHRREYLCQERERRRHEYLGGHDSFHWEFVTVHEDDHDVHTGLVMSRPVGDTSLFAKAIMELPSPPSFVAPSAEVWNQELYEVRGTASSDQ